MDSVGERQTYFIPHKNFEILKLIFKIAFLTNKLIF